VRLLNGDRGRLSVQEIESNINNIKDAHQSVSSVVALENTVVREAGSYYTISQVKPISEFARSKGLKMHLDGARLFNALTETGDNSAECGKYFDTISICLSKGLGAPVGSILAFKKEYEAKARRMRKAFGGGMRQAGFLAAAGIYALDNHAKRLKEDHTKAKTLGKELQNLSWVKSVMPVDTNIVLFEVAPSLSPEKVMTKFNENNIKALPFSQTEIRLVTHLDFTDDLLNKTIEIFKKLSF
jgi:threonine aldolase